MKIYRLPQLAESTPEGTYCLGFEDLNTRSVYMLYGRLRPNESARKVIPAEGTEEIICVIKGSLKVKSARASFSVLAGEAFHLKESETFILDNTGDEEAVFIAAGGRCRAGTPLLDKQEPKQDTATAVAVVAVETPSKEEPEFIITRDSAEGE